MDAKSESPAGLVSAEASGHSTPDILHEASRVVPTKPPMPVGERISDLKPATRSLDILFLTNTHNSMSQRAWLELTALSHKVTVELALDREQMVATAEKYDPEMIVTPFLTKFVDERIYSRWPTLIVHPGIHGDRGASSIDWALSKGLTEWGVTVLNATEVMDGGDIWSSINYPIHRNVSNGAITKSSMYGNEAVNVAMVALKEALHKYLAGIPPTPLDYSDPECKGALQPNMVQKDRVVDWMLSAPEVVQHISSADGAPGVLDAIAGMHVYMYGAPTASTRLECPLCAVTRLGALPLAATALCGSRI